jgi:hypothetical protein
MTNRIGARIIAAGRALALVAGAAVLASAQPYASAQQPDARRQVAAAIQESIRLLEAKQHLEFIKTFIRPSEVEELVAKFGSAENVAAESAKGDRIGTMLKRLHAASKLEPTFNTDGTIARYTFDAPIGREKGLSLQKIGERWYLRD